MHLCELWSLLYTAGLHTHARDAPTAQRGTHATRLRSLVKAALLTSHAPHTHDAHPPLPRPNGEGPSPPRPRRRNPTAASRVDRAWAGPQHLLCMQRVAHAATRAATRAAWRTGDATAAKQARQDAPQPACTFTEGAPQQASKDTLKSACNRWATTCTPISSFRKSYRLL